MRRLILRFVTAAQLTRLTVAFGAVSDVWFITLHARATADAGSTLPVVTMPLWLALFAGATLAIGLFAYGAALNDVLDARHDSAFSPDRPIPAGRIRPAQAIIVTISALIVGVLSGAAFGPWGLRLTLLVAVGILFYNAAGKYIPSVGFVTIGLIHAAHMFIPNPQLSFTLPVWLIMTHAMVIAAAAYRLEQKRPPIRPGSIAWTVTGWLVWTVILIAWGARREGGELALLPWQGLAWPILAAVAFASVARWKIIGAQRFAAAEKLRRYGAMWQALYASAWFMALGQRTLAGWMFLLAVAGFAGMTTLKEFITQINRPLSYRV